MAEEKLVEMSARTLSLASPGVPGNCRKQCSVVSQVDRPGSTMVVPVGQMGILSAHAWCCISVKNTTEETNDLCKSCNFMIVSLHILCYKLLIIKHVL